MAHTVRDKKKLLNRVRRIQGQLGGIENALTEERGCSEILQQIASVRGAMNGLMSQMLEGHVMLHVLDPDRRPKRAQVDAANELMGIIRTYLK